MSNAEHLIENALYAIKENQSFDDFKNMYVNQLMFQRTRMTAEEVWEMAMYVIYTFNDPTLD